MLHLQWLWPLLLRILWTSQLMRIRTTGSLCLHFRLDLSRRITLPLMISGAQWGKHLTQQTSVLSVPSRIPLLSSQLAKKPLTPMRCSLKQESPMRFASSLAMNTQMEFNFLLMLGNTGLKSISKTKGLPLRRAWSTWMYKLLLYQDSRWTQLCATKTKSQSTS